MNLDELRSVRNRERQTDKLQQLRETFYADAGEFIQELRDERDRVAERVDDPFDAPEVNRLTDEIDTAEGTVEAIYEKRVGKIVKAASFAAADLPAESDGMTAEERDLFETLVADIKANREHVLDVLAGEDPAESEESARSQAGTEEPAETEAETGPGDPGVSAADAMGSASGPDASAEADGSTSREERPGSTRDRPPGWGDGADGSHGTAQSVSPETATGMPTPDADGPETDGPDADGLSDERGGERGTGSGGPDRETVRITDDVGAIFGVDEREYDLAEDDVVTLPAANAEPLVERDAAERLD